MKTTGTRSMILYVFGIIFAVGLGVFLFGLVTNGGNWALHTFNRHITDGSQLAGSGNILDRNNIVLAETKDGERVYNSDESVRRATLHVVGDTRGYISTGIQYNYRADLSGYNLVTGLASPFGKTNGSNIKLTLDSSLCKLALQQLNGKKGAVSLYNYKTGEMLCMVSTPNYDPENKPQDLDTDTTGKYDGVYLNNVLSSSYTPGSIFKIVTLACAIDNIPDLESRTFQCNGSITVNGNKITCLAKHGTLNAKEGLAKSCNIVFAQLAMELGPEKMNATAKKMGFNQSFSLDGISTAKSSYDVSKASENELGWSGVGQFTDLTNPYHMMLLMGAVANNGTAVQPYLIDNITTSFGLTTRTGSTSSGPTFLDSDTALQIKTYMRYNVTNEYGDNLFPGLSVCAKTGTAEVGNNKNPNGWMVGFSADAKTPFAFAVVVEDTSSGIGSAGRIASAVMAQAAKTIS